MKALILALLFALFVAPFFATSSLAATSSQRPVRGFEKMGLTYAYDGLNCWGTALYAAGLREHYQYASDREYTATLENPEICRRLKEGEKVPYGAVGAIRQGSEKEFEELHGFVVLQGDEILTAKDFTFETGMQRRSMSKDFALFAQAGNTFKNCGPELKNGNYHQTTRKCSNWVDFYVCESGRTLTSVIQDPKARAIVDEVEKLMIDFEDHLRKGQPFTEEKANSLLEQMQPLMTQAYDLPEGHDRKAATTLYESMAFQFSSIYGEQKTKSELAD